MKFKESSLISNSCTRVKLRLNLLLINLFVLLLCCWLAFTKLIFKNDYCYVNAV
jgi:hypothetical protein